MKQRSEGEAEIPRQTRNRERPSGLCLVHLAGFCCDASQLLVLVILVVMLLLLLPLLPLLLMLPTVPMLPMLLMPMLFNVAPTPMLMPMPALPPPVHILCRLNLLDRSPKESARLAPPSLSSHACRMEFVVL